MFFIQLEWILVVLIADWLSKIQWGIDPENLPQSLHSHLLDELRHLLQVSLAVQVANVEILHWLSTKTADRVSPEITLAVFEAIVHPGTVAVFHLIQHDCLCLTANTSKLFHVLQFQTTLIFIF